MLTGYGRFPLLRSPSALKRRENSCRPSPPATGTNSLKINNTPDPRDGAITLTMVVALRVRVFSGCVRRREHERLVRTAHGNCARTETTACTGFRTDKRVSRIGFRRRIRRCYLSFDGDDDNNSVRSIERVLFYPSAVIALAIINCRFNSRLPASRYASRRRRSVVANVARSTSVIPCVCV